MIKDTKKSYKNLLCCYKYIIFKTLSNFFWSLHNSYMDKYGAILDFVL